MAQVRSVTVMLCTESVDGFEGALDQDEDHQEVTLRSDLPYEARLFVHFERRNRPAWLRFVQQGVADYLGDLVNVSNAAVLVIAREGIDGTRYFAVPFGRGRHLVDDNVYVRDFGLKVALNTIDPDQLVSLDVHTLEELPFHRRVQATRAAPPAAFGLDSYRDALTAVTGKPADESSRRLTGTDAVRLTRPLEFDRLGQLCDQLLQAYGEDRYQDRFGWIDQLRRVREPALRERLDRQLVAELRQMHSGDPPRAEAWLAPPEVIDWTRIEGFWITGTGRRRAAEELLAEPDLRWYLAGLTEPAAVDLNKLKQHRLAAYEDPEEPPRHRWTVYRTLIAEQERDGNLYVLINGTWYEIAQTLAEEVNDTVSALPITSVALPAAVPGEHEPDYNARAAADALHLLDRVPVTAGPTEGAVESCDLFHADGVFVHVKRYRKGSAELSHLFAQGMVSAHAFLREAVHRSDLRAKLVERAGQAGWIHAVIPDEQPAPAGYEVAYAIIAADWPRGAASLPFFAKLTMMRAARELKQLGYNVTLTRVPLAVQ